VSAGGVTRATDLDANDNPVSIHTLAASGGEFMFPTNLGYDTHGRLSSTTRGTRVERQTYFDTSDGSNGYLASHINPLSQETDYTRDSLGRALSELAPDLGETGYSWDAASNLTSVTPPGRPSHSMNYTAVDQLASYTPPTLASVQTPQTVFEYNFARQLTKVTRPDGVVLDYHYDSAGRLLTVTTPSGTLTNTYFPVAPCVGCAPGRLSQIAGFDGVNLSFTFDGFLPTKYTWSGAISGSVNNTYNTEFLLSTETVNAGNRSSSVSFAYDGDGSPILVGPMRITSRADDGQIASTRLGNLQDFISYNRLGELADQTTLLSSTVFRETYDSVIAPRDALGRIVRKSETLRDQQTAFDYTYDSASRLKTVKTDGVLTATYFYDTNGNRLTATKPSGSVSATYDDQDRLLTYGKFSYAYTANGELQRKTDTVSGAATTYNYDAFGNLKQVNLPSGDTVEYLVDGQNRRVAKKKNGAIVKQWLYRDGIHPVAELDASGNLVSTFVYVTGKNVPDYVVQSGGTFRILSDQIGSPRLVLEATTGALVQRLRHDEFGNVLEDTSPAFIPFGFGGGLYDVDTGLVRFGARDYDPVVGRWISKDPIRFDGGQANLYGYVNNDPIQNVDEDGLALRACAKALAKLAAAEARLAKRRFENMASSCGSDPGHDKAIDEAQNAVANASEQVARNCTAKDLVVLGAAGLLAGAVGSLSGGGGFAFAF